LHKVLNGYTTIRVVFLLLIFLFTIPKSLAQETIRIMSYNLNNYSSGTSRNNALKSVIGPVDPDIVVGIELTSSSQANNFRTNVLNQTGNGSYSMGTFLYNPNNGSDNNAVYFKSDKFSFVSRSLVVSSGSHPTYRFTLTNNSTGDQIIIFGVHLSSGNTIPDRNQRTAEANIIRNITDAYSSGVYFIAAGDFNFSSGTEQAFQVLLDTPDSGKFIDPEGFDGNHSWFSYNELFTYNTGGLFSRYDLILNSQSVVDAGGIKYQNNTFTVGGNDGVHNPPSAYQSASDHLPVYVDYTFGDALPVELSMFSGVLIGNRIDLHWRTETEVNNYGFNVERSVENNEWTTIAFVDGNGNSNSPKEYDYSDIDIYRSGFYSYRLKQIDNDGSFKYSNIVSINISLPDDYHLSQNFPNPFNPETRIDFTIPEKQFISLKVYNALGEMIKVLINEQKEAGSYTEIFDALGLPGGLYICRLEAPGFAETKKMILLK